MSENLKLLEMKVECQKSFAREANEKQGMIFQMHMRGTGRYVPYVIRLATTEQSATKPLTTMLIFVS